MNCQVCGKECNTPDELCSPKCARVWDSWAEYCYEGIAAAEDREQIHQYEAAEFSETARGFEARETWARDYDELNGAPEGIMDL